MFVGLTVFFVSSCGDSMGKSMGQEAKVEIKDQEATIAGIDEATAKYDADTAAATAKYNTATTTINATANAEILAAASGSASAASAAAAAAIAKQQAAATTATTTYTNELAASEATFMATPLTLTVPAVETGGNCSATGVKVSHTQFSIDFGNIDAGDTKSASTTLTVEQLSHMDESEPTVSFDTGSCKGATGTGAF